MSIREFEEEKAYCGVFVSISVFAICLYLYGRESTMRRRNDSKSANIQLKKV